MKHQRILFLCRSLDYGGAERQLVTLVRALHTRGHDVAVAVFYRSDAFEKELKEAGIQIFPLKRGGRWDIFGFFYRWAQLLSAFAPDVVHSYVVVPNIVSVSAKLFRPGIRVIWGIRDAYSSLDAYGRFAAFTFYMQRLFSRFADVAIANSQAGADAVTKSRFKLRRLYVIPNGIDVDRFQPDAAAGKKVRRELDVVEDCKLIGIVGRIDPVKGHGIFVEAAALLCRNHKNVRFLVLGNGTEEQRKILKRAVEQAGVREQFVFSDARSDIPAVMNALNILTSCSICEGFPNVVAEALACGIPCVVTKVGDSALVVGDCGRIIPPEDPISLMAAWQDVLDSNDLTTERLRNRVVENFTIKKLTDRSEEVLCFSR